MKVKQLVLFLFFLLCLSGCLYAQAWSGILEPTYGSGACNYGSTSAPGQCAIDWSTAGIPGGIPNRTTICANISASTYGNGASDATSGTQTALNGCGSGQVVMLSSGTFLINGNLTVPSNATLRGAGANLTILNANGTSGAVITLGAAPGLGPYISGSVSITSGASAGSSSIVVSSASGIRVGSYLLITELNDSSYVSIAGADGSCTWCDGGTGWNGTRVRGQIVEVESVTGTTVGISPSLYSNYSHTPLATPFSAAAKYAGVENLQVYANNTGYGQNFYMSECAYCWISGVEGNYTDGDHVDVHWSYHGEIVNSYFSNAYLHTPGAYDSDIDVIDKSTAMLVQNNILERLHASIMLEWGAAGNVISYNYTLGNFDNSAYNGIYSGIDEHGAHPQFNLYEGNSDISTHLDSDWGSSSNDTLFRNFMRGTTKDCNPQSGRGTVVCSPMGMAPQSGYGPGVNGWWLTEGAIAENISFLQTNFNSVGNVLGSQDMANLTAYDQGSPALVQRYMAVAVCGPSPCGSGSRDNFTSAYSYTLGYGESGDSGGGTHDSIAPYNTLFIHGDYSSATKSVTWANGVTHTLPASFYLSSKPAWFGNVPWPAIGPDVSGGISNAFGYAYAIPAEACYEQVMGGTDGTGSPLVFNASNCYGQQSPAPPANPTATAH
jgi:hypothetical protein